MDREIDGLGDRVTHRVVRQKTQEYNARLNVQVDFDPIELPIENSYYLPPD